MPTLANEEDRPSDQSEPGHAPRDEAGPVHQVAEDQPVPKGNDESGAEQERPVLERGEREGSVVRAGKIVPQAHDSEHEDDPHRDEDALDDSSTDVADREGLVLPPRDRVEDDGRSDVRDDEEELQESAQVDLVVLPATSDVPDRIIENWLEERERADRRDERDDEQHSEDPAVPLVVTHFAPFRRLDCRRFPTLSTSFRRARTASNPTWTATITIAATIRT